MVYDGGWKYIVINYLSDGNLKIDFLNYIKYVFVVVWYIFIDKVVDC